MTQRLFLSTVTSDFGPLRDFLAEQLRPSGFHVVHQREFIETGRNTLVKLAEFIESESDIVLHCLGPSTGSVPPTEYTDELLRQCGEELHQRFRSLFEDDAFRRLTYTQWEAWLGKFYGKLVLPYQSAAAAAVPIQHDNTPMSNGEHLERLKPLAGYPTPFTGNADLLDQVKTALLRQRTGGAASVRLPNNLPYPTLGTLFKGREPFLKAVQEKFQSGANVVGVMTPVAAQAVHGLGGVGKTRAAVEYAWRHETEFTALLFVTADSPENLQRQLASLVGPLVLNIPEAQLVTNQEAQVAAAIHWLQEHPRWCLILDNVDTEPAAVAVQQLLTQLTRGRVLITSRLSRWSGGVEKLELDVLEPQDACDYLLEKTSGERESAPDDETQARAIANDLDHLILGLEQAAAYITALGLSLGGYRQRWESKRMEILGYLDPVEMTYPKSLAVTWETSFAQLSSEGQLLLEHLAWFAPEPVPMFLFDDQKPSTVWNELLGGDARLALANLKRYSLAKQQSTAQGATILVHRLVQEITRGRIAAPDARDADQRGVAGSGCGGSRQSPRCPDLDALGTTRVALRRRHDIRRPGGNRRSHRSAHEQYCSAVQRQSSLFAGGTVDAPGTGDRRAVLRSRAPRCRPRPQQPGTAAAGHEPTGGGGAAAAAGAGDRRAVLRTRPPRCRPRPQQPGAFAAGHEPSDGGGAAAAAGAGDFRLQPRGRPSVEPDGGPELSGLEGGDGVAEVVRLSPCRGVAPREALRGARLS